MTDDETLAFEFLAGGTRKETDGKISFEDLEPGSEAKAKGQQALVRLLRSGLPLRNDISHRLAALFDPTHPWEARKLVIVPRKGSEQPNHQRDLEIAMFLSAELRNGRQMESATRDAMRVYGVSRSTARLAWKEHGGSPLAPDPR